MEEAEIFKDFENHDRNQYPDPVYRVTGGMGGEALLILGSEKTALYDVGMACFADRLITNIDCILEGTERTLDLILLSHTHYDHIGGLPYVLRRWPKAEVCASRKAAKVFESEGAKATIARLGKNAADFYGIDHMEMIVDGMRVDRILRDKDKIDLGKQWIQVYETKGHTDCAMTYMLLPEKILFTCESTGVLVNPQWIDTSVLKDFDETIRVAERLKTLHCSYLISPHYGVVPPWFNQIYFDMYIQAAKKEKTFIESLIEEGKSFEQIMEAHKAFYWRPERAKAQPYAAYRLNTENVVKQVMQKLKSI